MIRIVNISRFFNKKEGQSNCGISYKIDSMLHYKSTGGAISKEPNKKLVTLLNGKVEQKGSLTLKWRGFDD